MRCPRCTVEVLVQQGQCPNCGWIIIAPAERQSFGRKHPALLISVTLAAFVVVAGTIGFTVDRILKTGSLAIHRLRKSEYPVAHGPVVRPEELHGHGKLYFVPVGSQVIPVQLLADYYLEKFGTEITVLPHVDIQPADCIPQRRQCVAEELEAEMTTAYPDIARDPDSVMIALTDEDIFPRELGWRFTYSLHSARFGIVSTRRMDPAFWGDKPGDAIRLASTKQMLTKYVAMMYYRVPDSFDPTSVMHTPLTPDGRNDDLYESNLHPDATVNGRRGTPFPCLFFTYSYLTHEITQLEPALTDCRNSNVAHADEETFELNLGWGRITQRSMDLQLDSTPAIAFRRGYVSDYLLPMAMGQGGNHTYNTFLSSDGPSALTYISIVHEDGRQDYLNRVSPGRGFNPGVVFESREDGIRGARLTWARGEFELHYRDGAWSGFLPCEDARCYWTGYVDSKGNILRLQRGSHLELLRVTGSDQQGITFRSDDKQRIIEAVATNGKKFSYEYDADGCLARVRRSDGQVTLYAYDPSHRMTSVSVIPQPGAPPQEILANQYDSRGRVVKQTLAGVGAYKIEYLATRGNYASELRVTDPAGQVLRISIDADDYVVHASSIRFPAVVAHR